MDITKIKNPEFLKKMSINQLDGVAFNIREFLIENIAKTGGHLSSNLGIIELTMAIHYVFDASKDKIIFDVGHQAYTHKILTGRAADFHKLRKYQGLSGFQKRKESSYDVWGAGHATTSISAALGFATTRDLQKENHDVIAIIGDGSMTGGMAFEALNNIGENPYSKVIVILNDNEMSISKNVGSISNILSRLRSSDSYIVAKKSYRNLLMTSVLGKVVYRKSKRIKDFFKKGLINDSFFGDFGMDYIGPVDGHDFKELLQAMTYAKKQTRSIVVHVKTKKGKGYLYSEEDDVGKWHGVDKYDVKKGLYNKKSEDENVVSWSLAVSTALENLMDKDADILAITPAMMQGSRLEKIFDKYPNRCFDVGIAEEHAVTYAGALAISGKKPFLSIYSTFLQRGYDQLLHDVAIQQAHVVFGVDRAGFVGSDGETHHGLYDVAYASHIPGVVIAMPKDGFEMQNMLYTAFYHNELPFIMRYSKANILYEQLNDYQKVEVGSWEYSIENEKSKLAIITYGSDVNEVCNLVLENNMDVSVINARYLKPLDSNMLMDVCNNYDNVIVYEPTSSKLGGLGSLMLLELSRNLKSKFLDIMAIEDHFVDAGSIEELLEQENVSINSLKEKVLGYLNEN